MPPSGRRPPVAPTARRRTSAGCGPGPPRRAHASTWTARDEDAYRGPFTRHTLAPVLVVGNLWDPATNYRGAQRAAALLPNSRLLTSDSWGHTAFGSSACVDLAVERYLLRQAVPAQGARCTGDVQPFQEPAQASASAAGTRARPPVVPLVPFGG